MITPEKLQMLKRRYTISGVAIVFHPHEPVVASGELTGRIKLWNLLDGSLLHELIDLHEMVFDIDFPRDRYVLTAAFGANAVVIDVETGGAPAAVDGLGQLVLVAAFLPKGVLLAVRGSNGIKF